MAVGDQVIPIVILYKAARIVVPQEAARVVVIKLLFIFHAMPLPIAVINRSNTGQMFRKRECCSLLSPPKYLGNHFGGLNAAGTGGVTKLSHRYALMRL